MPLVSAAVVAARTTFRLPYYWSHMNVSSTGSVMTYQCRRRWPGPSGAGSSIAIRTGDAFDRDELGDLDHWLTARFRLYAVAPHGLRAARGRPSTVDAAPRRACSTSTTS